MQTECQCGGNYTTNNNDERYSVLKQRLLQLRSLGCEAVCFVEWGGYLGGSCCLIFWREDKALSTSKMSLLIKQTTRCQILDDKSPHTERCYTNNTHLLSRYAVWRVTEHTVTFRRSEVLAPTNCSWCRHYHSLISRTTSILIINVWKPQT
jgi:hypothetical protein